VDLKRRSRAAWRKPCHEPTRTCPFGLSLNTTSRSTGGGAPIGQERDLHQMVGLAIFRLRQFATAACSWSDPAPAPGNRCGPSGATFATTSPGAPERLIDDCTGGDLTEPRPGPASRRPVSSTTASTMWRSWNGDYSIATVPARVGGTDTLERVRNSHGKTRHGSGVTRVS
jgi:hypothetical protein